MNGKNFSSAVGGSIEIGRTIDFSISGVNAARINLQHYDLTRGRVFLMQANGTLKQLSVRPRRLASGNDVTEFMTRLLSHDNSPGQAMRTVLKAAKDRNSRVFRSGRSQPFLDEIDKRNNGATTFGDFDNVKFISATQIDDKTAEVVAEAEDESKRRFTFKMTLEDGRWKLNPGGL